MGIHSRDIRSVALREGLLMVGNHSVPRGKSHWRANASAFAIVDYSGHPMVWLEAPGPATMVVGDMAVTMPKPSYAGPTRPEATPGALERLIRFEVLVMAGVPVIRTWWAIGEALTRTAKNVRLEYLNDATLPDRCRQLAQLLNWKG